MEICPKYHVFCPKDQVPHLMDVLGNLSLKVLARNNAGNFDARGGEGILSKIEIKLYIII